MNVLERHKEHFRHCQDTGAQYVAMVLTAAATMPNSCWGEYRRVALVLVDTSALPEGCVTPTMISTHARGVVKIIETWEKLNVGTTERCAYHKALAEAHDMADEMNADPEALAVMSDVELEKKQ